MFEVKKNLSIHITRGNIGSFKIGAKNKDKSDYVFQIGDVVRLGVYEKGNFNKMVLEKRVTIEEPTISVDISLTKQDTTIGPIINSVKDYWYEIELNPDNNPQTIIGYDESGAKIFRLYPEGVDE